MTEQDYKQQAKTVLRNKPDKKNIIIEVTPKVVSDLGTCVSTAALSASNFRTAQRRDIHIPIVTKPASSSMCGQLSLRRSKVATVETRQIIKAKQLDIVLVQESYAGKGDIEGLGHTLIISKSNQEKLWSAVMLSNNTSHLYLKQLSIDKITTIMIQDFIPMYFISAYFPPRHDIIIAAYTNSKSKLWCSETEDERDNLMEIFIANNYLHILNEKKKQYHNIGFNTRHH
ncbi:hypothetical protein PR048_009424 [Dryococelus australis]|uniref:Uncharacterized protein n=1 Tax=Dryococelus australis TaxID=614101 RepID=A0ABQ9HZV8_9NEOP|nr:hypothetical protein PR048_009424 [Dryococelus australis]